MCLVDILYKVLVKQSILKSSLQQMVCSLHLKLKLFFKTTTQPTSFQGQEDIIMNVHNLLNPTIGQFLKKQSIIFWIFRMEGVAIM